MSDFGIRTQVKAVIPSPFLDGNAVTTQTRSV